MAVFGLLYGYTREKSKIQCLLCKALGTFMAVIMAGLNAIQGGEVNQWLIFISLVLCMIADIVLEINFIKGIVVFGLAHIGFITAFGLRETPRWYTVFIAGAICALLLSLFRKKLSEVKELKAAGYSYAIVLSLMASMAISIYILSGTPGSLVLMLGCICFVVSDSLIAYKTLYGKQEKIYGLLIMTLYYGAVYMISIS